MVHWIVFTLRLVLPFRRFTTLPALHCSKSPLAHFQIQLLISPIRISKIRLITEVIYFRRSVSYKLFRQADYFSRSDKRRLDEIEMVFKNDTSARTPCARASPLLSCRTQSTPFPFDAEGDEIPPAQSRFRGVRCACRGNSEEAWREQE